MHVFVGELIQCHLSSRPSLLPQLHTGLLATLLDINIAKQMMTACKRLQLWACQHNSQPARHMGLMQHVICLLDCRIEWVA